jgi:LacI family transcriptional regulator
MALTIKDLANMANTSTATVSRVLSNKPGVAGAKRRVILELAEKVGYSPNRIARNLAMKKSYVLGFIAADLRNPSYIDFIRRVHRQVKALGYQVLIADSERDVAKERDNIAVMREHRAEGLIIFPVNDWQLRSEVDHLLQLKLQKFPFVLVGRIEGYAFDYVVAEEVESARRMAEHLIEQGRRRLAFVGSSNDNRCIVERQEGVRLALEAHGLTLQPRHVISLTEDDSWLSNLRALLTAPERPDALVFVNDILTMQAYRLLLDLGLEIPRDVAVCAFGDGLWATSLRPSMTTTSEDGREIARLATETLLRRIEDPGRPATQIMVPQRLNPRESTTRATAG